MPRSTELAWLVAQMRSRSMGMTVDRAVVRTRRRSHRSVGSKAPDMYEWFWPMEYVWAMPDRQRNGWSPRLATGLMSSGPRREAWPHSSLDSGPYFNRPHRVMS